jgi:hypothetical protein
MNKKKQYSPHVFIGQNVYIKPSYLVSIPEFYREGGNHPSLEFLKNQENLKDNSQNGKLSRKAITGLKNSINWLCIAAKKKRVYDRQKQREFNFKVNFVTLTLPDTKNPINSQELQKNLLNPFLVYMRKYHGLRNYVWRLEFQANGKLHVHISADTFLHYRTVRDAWNRLLHKNGYLDLFIEKEGHGDPNSTDVHSTRKVNNMAAYLAKYMSKQGAEYKYPLKSICDKINSCIAAGVGEKQLSVLIEKKIKLQHQKLKAWGASGFAGDWKRWYFHRVNFWNSPFNPRPITGRIWGSSKMISQANKTVVHIPADQCQVDLKCLMNPEIPYKEIFRKPKETIYSQYAPDDAASAPQKIGEVYFLTAMDWFTKISGSIRKTFEQARDSIASLTDDLIFEL